MIKVLFLAGTPGLLKNTNKYNGGGWIASLQKEIERSYSNQVKISLAYPNEHNSYENDEGTDYYGIETIKHTFWKYRQKEAKFCERIKEVIDAVCPDVILCFGKEIVLVPNKWKGYCFWRNTVFNAKGHFKIRNYLSFYFYYSAYYLFKKRDLGWLVCFNKAFFSGFKEIPDEGFKTYMQ